MGPIFRVYMFGAGIFLYAELIMLGKSELVYVCIYVKS
jgi:hypothetical protein